jgi:hypothetical protein
VCKSAEWLPDTFDPYWRLYAAVSGHLPVCTPAHWRRSVTCRRMAVAQADQGVTLSNSDTCMPCMCQTFHELHALQFCIHALLVPASKRGKSTYGTEEVYNAKEYTPKYYRSSNWTSCALTSRPPPPRPTPSSKYCYIPLPYHYGAAVLAKWHLGNTIKPATRQAARQCQGHLRQGQHLQVSTVINLC